MELYGTTTSPYTRVVRIMALELGFDLPMRDMYWRKSSAELFDVNPAGRIPLLVDGDVSLGESRTICNYLLTHGDARPNETLRPLSGAMRWQEESLLGLIYAAIDSLVVVRVLSDPPAATHPYLDRCHERMDHCFRAIDQVAAKGYLVDAGSFGMAEAALVSAADVIEGRSLADLQAYSNVGAVRSQLAARPSVEQTAPVF